MRSVVAQRSQEEKFWQYIMPEPNTGCWLWAGHLTDDLKYGRFAVGAKRHLAHHFSYCTYVGPIPPGMEIHHKCNVGWCVNPQHLQPLTKLENLRIMRSGTLPVFKGWASDRKSALPRDMKSRFLSFVKKTRTCWLWQGATNEKYGIFIPRHGKMVYAHRASYEIFTGPIPDGLDIDHLCSTPRCVNPSHLEPVTRSVNLLRKHARIHGNACGKGHEFTEANTRIDTATGGRSCRRCHANTEARRRTAKKQLMEN